MKDKFQSKLLKLFFTLILGCTSLTTVGQIIISQVYNGVNNNKCIEITNIGDNLDLSFPVQYKIGLWEIVGTAGTAGVSGNPTGYINLSGTLIHGQKCVISNSGSTAPISNINVLLITNNTVTTFDGNDGLAIFTDTNTLVDAFGIGINYNSISYERQEQVVSPKPDFRLPEWISKTLVQFSAAASEENTLLGVHYYFGNIITTTGTLTSLSTTYGTASTPTSLLIRCDSFSFVRIIQGGGGPPPPLGLSPLFATIPLGFEASTSSSFSSNVQAGGTTFEVFNGDGSITLYIRLQASTTVGNNSGLLFLTQTNPYEEVYIPTDAINTVNAKQISISALVANNKVNDGTTQATLRGNAFLSGVLNADASNVILGGTPVANFNNVQTGNSKPVTVSGYSISGSKSENYVLNQPIGLTANITDVLVPLLPQTLSISALANVVYGSSNFNLTATVSSGLAANYISSNPNVAVITGNVLTITGAGTTTITAFQFGDSVYDAAPSVNQLLTVTPKQLTLNASAVNKIYDRTAVATITGTLVGRVGSDVVTFVGTGTFNSSNVGNGIGVTSTSSLGGINAANYTFIQPTGLTANILVRPITSIATVAGKVYDRTTTATITGTLVGVLGADVVNFVGSGFFNSFRAGTVAVTSTSTLSGAQAGNYSLTQPTGLSAVIAKKVVTVSNPVAANKSFDGTTAATISGTLLGVISPDLVTLLGTGTFASSAVGTGIAVTSTSTLGFFDAANYVLTQPTGLVANITPPATVLAVGDLSVVGFQWNTPDSFAFVTWVDIATNTYIKFTDNGFLNTASANATNNARGGENFVIWRNSGAPILTGTVIIIQDNSSTAITNNGSIVPGNLNGLSSAGDTIFAYQGAATSGSNPDWNANTNPTTFTGTILFGLYGQGTATSTSWITTGGASANNSYLPSQLNVANGNIAFGGSATRGQYTGSRSNQTSFSAYKALVSNPANWTLATNTTGTITFTTTGFTVPPASTAAVISGNASICLGASSNLNVNITGGTSPFKIVYSDGNTSFTVNNYVSGTNISISPTISTNYTLISVTDSNNLIGSNNSGTAILMVTSPTTTGSESVTACGPSYTWAVSGQSYNVSGVYPFVSGCNTATLTLTLNSALQTFYMDTDGDGFGAGAAILSCIGQPVGTSTNNTDCSPEDPLQWQFSTFYVDTDIDTYGSTATASVCSGINAPSGFSVNNLDCDDTNATLNPTNPCPTNSIVNLTLFIQGYYTGGVTMKSVKLNQWDGFSAAPSATEVKDLTIELHDAATYEPLHSTTATLNTDGTLSALFPGAPIGSFYVAVKGSNIVQTWSAAPQTVGAIPLSYDFSSAASQAYGDNMLEVETGVFAMYQGDLVSDDLVDTQDYVSWEGSYLNGDFGVQPTDFNGDGLVDTQDYTIWEGNYILGVFASYPF